MTGKAISHPSKSKEPKHSRKPGEAYIEYFLVLLGVAMLVRSEVLVDSSLLSRAIILNILLLIAYVYFFGQHLFPRIGIWVVSLVGFYLWNLISSFWSLSPAESITQAQMVFLGLGVFTIVSFVDRTRPDFIISFIRIQILLLLFSFILAFARVFELEYFDPYKINSFSMNNNLYSGYLLLSLPLLFMGYSLNTGVWKYLSVLSIILCLFFIIIVQSRAVYLGLALTLFLLFAGTLLKYRKVLIIRNILTGLTIIVVLAVAILAFYRSLDDTRKNAFQSKIALWNYFYNNEGTGETPSSAGAPEVKKADTPTIEIPVEYFENVNARLIFWKKSLGLIRDNPVLGIGAGNWRLTVASITEPENPELTLKNYTYSQPHNEWIAILSELGLIGSILAFMIFLLPVIFIFINSAKRGVKEIPFSIFYLAAFLSGFYVFASFDFPLRRVEHLVLLFSLFGLIYNRVQLTGYNKTAIKWFPKGKYFNVFMIISLLFTMIVLSGRIKGEYFTRKVFIHEKKNIKKVIEYSEKAKGPFYTVTPNALPIDWFSGVAHFQSGNTTAARLAFQSALETTPYEVRVLNDYSAALYKSGQSDAARSQLIYALQLDPHFDDAKFNLAAIYFEMSMPDSALYYVNSCRDSQKKKDYLGEIYSSYFK